MRRRPRDVANRMRAGLPVRYDGSFEQTLKYLAANFDTLTIP